MMPDTKALTQRNSCAHENSAEWVERRFAFRKISSTIDCESRTVVTPGFSRFDLRSQGNDRRFRRWSPN